MRSQASTCALDDADPSLTHRRFRFWSRPPVTPPPAMRQKGDHPTIPTGFQRPQRDFGEHSHPRATHLTRVLQRPQPITHGTPYGFPSRSTVLHRQNRPCAQSRRRLLLLAIGTNPCTCKCTRCGMHDQKFRIPPVADGRHHSELFSMHQAILQALLSPTRVWRAPSVP